MWPSLEAKFQKNRCQMWNTDSFLLDWRSIDLSGEREKEGHFHYTIFLRVSKWGITCHTCTIPPKSLYCRLGLIPINPKNFRNCLVWILQNFVTDVMLRIYLSSRTQKWPKLNKSKNINCVLWANKGYYFKAKIWGSYGQGRYLCTDGGSSRRLRSL